MHAEMVQPSAPWTTVWPVWVALSLWIGGLWGCREHLLRRFRGRYELLGVFVLAMVLRLVVLPVFGRHQFDGHEAEYWDIFTGSRPLGRGGLVLYPSMQWFWWALGRVLPHTSAVPPVVSALIASCGVVVWADAFAILERRSTGLFVGLLLSMLGAHAAWSSSAYNVAIPWFFSAVFLWCIAGLGLHHRVPLQYLLLCGFSYVLSVSTRLDSGIVGVAALPILFWSVQGAGVRRAWMVRNLRIVPFFALTALWMCACIWPLLFPGEIPGAGERALSFCINQDWLGPLFPGGAPLWVLTVSCFVIFGAWSGPQWRFLGVLVSLLIATCVTHLVLSSFDDYADRHGLWVWFPLSAMLGLCWTNMQRFRIAWALLPCALLVLLVSDLVALRERFYGSEEAYLMKLEQDSRWRSLPRWSVAEALLDPTGEVCGWVGEDPRVAIDPVRSHFNLLDPLEAESLRGPNGCLRWCVDVQDWRWSSRGVRDRALRVAHLFAVEPVAVVTDSSSGYGCLVLDVQSRQVCPDASTSPPLAARFSSTSVIP